MLNLERTRTWLLIFLIAWTSFNSTSSFAGENIWFSPDNETPDFLELFQRPDLWEKARSNIDVFKFGPQQLSAGLSHANSLSDLERVSAFEKLTNWGKKIAIEVPAIKAWDCSGEKAAATTAKLVEAVAKAGGTVAYLAMDEPLISGKRACNQNVEVSALKVVQYVKLVRQHLKAQHVNPETIEFGDIEAYPSISIHQILSWIDELKRQGLKLNFLHIDPNVHFIDLHPEVAPKSDLLTLKRYLNEQGISFGVIYWSGYAPISTDKIYFLRTLNWAYRVHNWIGSSDQTIVQSWIVRSSNKCTRSDASCMPSQFPCEDGDPAYCGKKSIPLNLPEAGYEVFSHARLVNEIVSVLKGSAN